MNAQTAELLRNVKTVLQGQGYACTVGPENLIHHHYCGLYLHQEGDASPMEAWVGVIYAEELDDTRLYFSTGGVTPVVESGQLSFAGGSDVVWASDGYAYMPLTHVDPNSATASQLLAYEIGLYYDLWDAILVSASKTVAASPH